LVYEHDTWFKKDPTVHKRSERNLYYPKVLGKEYSNLPNLEILGDSTIITGIEDGEIFTLLIRSKNLSMHSLSSSR